MFDWRASVLEILEIIDASAMASANLRSILDPVCVFIMANMEDR